MSAQGTNGKETALDRLVRREEVLEICYWYEGERLGDACTSAALEPFLHCEADVIDLALRELAEAGYVDSPGGEGRGYRLTAAGKREAARLFADSFADLQKQGHGECVAGCCEEDDHSRCGAECSFHTG